MELTSLWGILPDNRLSSEKFLKMKRNDEKVEKNNDAKILNIFGKIAYDEDYNTNCTKIKTQNQI